MNTGRMKLAALCGGALFLAGCATTQTSVPIEDRTPVPVVEKVTVPQYPVESNTTPAGSVVTPVQRQGVSVTPIESISVEPAAPISQEQSQKIATGGQWAQVTQKKSDSFYTPNPAVAPLLRSARVHAKQGLVGKAQASLDRAQRIAPNEPQVYLQMAQLRQRADKWQQAEQLALKGVQVGQGKAEILRDLWLLIADVREQKGDRTGAQRANIKARRYE